MIEITERYDIRDRRSEPPVLCIGITFTPCLALNKEVDVRRNIPLLIAKFQVESISIIESIYRITRNFTRGIINVHCIVILYPPQTFKRIDIPKRRQKQVPIASKIDIPSIKRGINFFIVTSEGTFHKGCYNDILVSPKIEGNRKCENMIVNRIPESIIHAKIQLTEFGIEGEIKSNAVYQWKKGIESVPIGF